MESSTTSRALGRATLQSQRPSLLVGIELGSFVSQWLNITIRCHRSHKLFLRDARTMACSDQLHLEPIYLSDNGRHSRSDSKQGYQQDHHNYQDESRIPNQWHASGRLDANRYERCRNSNRHGVGPWPKWEFCCRVSIASMRNRS
jgi:hypothetical protein